MGKMHLTQAEAVRKMESMGFRFNGVDAECSENQVIGCKTLGLIDFLKCRVKKGKKLYVLFKENGRYLKLKK